MSTKQVWFNGELIPADQARVSIFDHGLLYGDGVFEGIRIYQSKIFKMRSHLHRLFYGAEYMALAMPYDLEELAEATRKTVRVNGLDSGYIRLVVTRGTGTLGLNPFVCKNPVVFIIADSIQLYPRRYYDDGLSIITAKTIRNHPGATNPAVKSLNYLNNIFAKIEAIRADALEAIMLNHEGNVTECTGDNLFIVAGGEVVTPPLTAGILPGITRQVVMDLARQVGLTAVERDFNRQALDSADECFLTGTAAEVIPVTRIDGRPVGSGKPGPITRQLFDAFHALVSHDPPED